MLRHFKTRYLARKYIEAQGYAGHNLLIAKRKRKSKKPYLVGTSIALLHRPDSAY